MTIIKETMLGEDIIGAITKGDWKYPNVSAIDPKAVYFVVMNIDTVTFEQVEEVTTEWLKKRLFPDREHHEVKA